MCYRRSFGQLLLGQTKNIYVRRGTKAVRKFNRLDISKLCAWRHKFKKCRKFRGVKEHNLIQIPTNNHHRKITDKFISLRLINARSVARKAVSLCKHIPEKCVDILAITKTWLREGDDCHINDLCPPGYLLVCQDLRLRELEGGCNQGKHRRHVSLNKNSKHSKLALSD